ncbi:MAG TPA: M1 family metallopeptidase [Candidatus Binatia bacterium]|nr:M1 family metallopeptidase [Candidatus Binatia bacterium]
MNPRVPRRSHVLFSAIVLTLAAASVARADEARLPTDVQPRFEAVQLQLDPSKPDYTGTVRVDLTVRQPTETIRFHAQALDLRRVELAGADGKTLLAYGPDDHGIVTAKGTATIAPGDYVLTIDFVNDFDRTAASLFRLETGGRWYAYTQFEAVDARKAFPCWDEPAYKVPWQVTLSIPDGQEAVSNTPVEKDTRAGGVRTLVFGKTKPLPSYLIAMAVGPLEFVPISGLRVPGRVVVPQGSKALASTAATMTPPLFDALERWFGIPYPYEKLDLIAVPEFSPGAMENPGAITYGDQFLLFDEKSISASQKRTFAVFTAHEMAHMWFGDYVTMKWWDDLWLNESFAEWMGDKIADQVFPAYRIPLHELSDGERALATDAQLATHAVRRPVKTMDNLYEAADDLAYHKGQAVLYMTERWIGPEVFRKGVVGYLKEHAYGSAEGKDLWNALGRASGKDVPGVLASFLDQPGVPVVNAELKRSGEVELSQKRFLNYGVAAPERTLWKIPVTLLWISGGKPKTLSVLLDQERMTVRLPGKTPPWVHPNADEGGYYRWSVDAGSLPSLIADAPTALTARERVGFVQNATGLLHSGAIHGDRYLEALAGFSEDSNPLVIQSLANALTGVEDVFVTDTNEGGFAAYVRRLLGPAMRRFGIDRKPGEDEAVSLVRPSLYDWLGDEGHDEEVLGHAEALAASFLRDRASIDPSLIAQSLRLSAIRGDSTRFGEYQRRFEAATVPAERGYFLSALGTFRDPALRRRALDYVLTGPLRPQEYYEIPQAIGALPRQRDEVWAWWTGHYQEVVARMPPEYAMFIPFSAGGCSATRLQSAQAFFADPKNQKAGTMNMLAKVAEGTQDCLELREREGAAVDRALGARAEAGAGAKGGAGSAR